MSTELECARTTRPKGRSAAAIDHDLHGLIGVRLIDAHPSDAAAVARQLGPTRAALDRDPDITIRFVDRGTFNEPMRLLGAQEVGYTSDSFFILRGKHKSTAKVRIPFEDIGQNLEIVCERGAKAVPLLIPIINLTLLARGILPLHASAFVYHGAGILTTGWSKGGKTEALLAFADKGAQYIGDEWVYLTSDGRMFGIPEPLRVWKWHLDSLPQLARSMAAKNRASLRLKSSAAAVAKIISKLGRWLKPLRTIDRIRPLIEGQLFVDVPAERLFPGSSAAQGARLDRLFFVASREQGEISLQAVDPLEVAGRMLHSLAEERSRFMPYYRMFCFAFPEATCQLVEQASRIERELLANVLSRIPSYEVLHPYPMHVPDLYTAMRPYCQTDRDSATVRPSMSSFRAPVGVNGGL